MDQATLRELATNVSSYFLQFLETDFKKQKAPRRKIQTRTENDLLASMRLRRFPSLNAAVHDLLGRKVSEGLQMKVALRQHLSPLSATLGDLVNQHVDAIPDEHFERARQGTLGFIQQGVAGAKKHPGQWVQGVVDYAMRQVAGEVVVPLLHLLEGPLQEDARSAIDSALALESDVVGIVCVQAVEALPQALNTYIVTGDLDPTRQVLADCLSAQDGRRRIKEYFRTFGTTDAYYELVDLTTYLKTAENLQFYLYAGTLRFGNHTYPLFYVPGTLTPVKDSAEFLLEFDPHVFVNKAAVDFVLQQRTAATRAAGPSPVRDRILYLGADQTLRGAIAGVMPKLCTAVELPGAVNISTRDHETQRTVEVVVDNGLLFAVFDKSDEAILNDYEELLTLLNSSSQEVTALFEDIVKGVIMEDPVSVRREVDSVMQAEDLPTRLVTESPIPMNEEQREIRHALKNPACRFVVVEGPPGTGKSHTISALAFDAIMQGQSTLILSDKTEALDVVEDKLNSTLLTVRGDQDFENPFLRLGRQGANYRRITSRASLTQLRTHHAAQLANRQSLDNELAVLKNGLIHDIRETLTTYTGLKMEHLVGHVDREKTLAAQGGSDYLQGLYRAAADTKLMVALSAVLPGVSSGAVAKAGGLIGGAAEGMGAMVRTIKLVEGASQVSAGQARPFVALDLMRPLSRAAAEKCLEILWRFGKLRRPIIGYLFRAQAVADLEREFYATGHARGPVDLRKDGDEVKRLLDFVVLQSGNMDKLGLQVQDVEALQEWMRRGEDAAGLDRVREFLVQWDAGTAKLPALARPKGSAAETLAWYVANARHAVERHAILKAFDGLPNLDYLNDKTRLEHLYTCKMADRVDGRFLDFADQQAAKMRTLAGVIAQRQKFPTDHFDALRNACPVILASIREFAEYMPLHKGLFDLLIIDEGSQVSIAQALPAILRAKKVVVFGDSRQFANVKAANASIERNNVFKAGLREFFVRKVSDDAARLQRLATFDVKASVLEFFQYCANFHVMLRKHFRSPQELISFSSENFYRRQLQAIKVRTLPMDQTIRFDRVEAAPQEDGQKNVNKAEAAFILEKLRLMLKDEAPPSVGIITPFREQQIYLTREIARAAESQDFDRKLRLKIMTFDTCQGEEREVIFYSMVATKDRDVLNYIFPASFHAAEEDIEEKLKLQRLNVGFSRAQETIWFVLSKDVSEYKGSIAVALQHYQRVLEERKLGEAAETDARSPMEPKVLGWLKAAPFIQERVDEVEIQPQFPIGRYLQQLDPTYRHPNWKVDFLVTFDLNEEVVRVVVEYDGFEYHFDGSKQVTAGNYETYMSEADLHRQLIIESYGYHFVRLNRFNTSPDPVQAVSEALRKRVEAAVADKLPAAAAQVIETREQIVNGTHKACSRCGQVQPLEAFFDPALQRGEGGHGRVCRHCKTRRAAPRSWRRRGRRW